MICDFKDIIMSLKYFDDKIIKNRFIKNCYKNIILGVLEGFFVTLICNHI
jgi:hypothetical protein